MSTQEATQTLVHEEFELKLNQAKGSCSLSEATCKFAYTWDTVRNMGQARLISIDGTLVNIPLYPLGIYGMWAFMSDMKPTAFPIGGQETIIFRVILDVKYQINQKTAALMLNQDGSCILETENFEGEVSRVNA
ncbi:hypothetical protein BKI52_19230 [marine bacterium AO1-C]|nr:hypothetical protein BKI52_19230 [marine bacterium AO1-C]